MTRRRDVRRFGRGPYVLGMRRDPARWEAGFPFDLPALSAAVALAGLAIALTGLASERRAARVESRRRPAVAARCPEPC